MLPAVCDREAVYSFLKVGHSTKERVSSSCLEIVAEVSGWFAGARVQHPAVLFPVETN